MRFQPALRGFFVARLVSVMAMPCPALPDKQMSWEESCLGSYGLRLSFRRERAAFERRRSDYLRVSEAMFLEHNGVEERWVWFPFGFDTSFSAATLTKGGCVR